MKRLKDFITLLALSIIVSIAGLTSSCKNNYVPREGAVEVIVAKVLPDVLQEKLPEIIVESQNPTFYDSVDAVVYKLVKENQVKTDSIFLSLSDQQVATISYVLSNRQETFTVHDIVNEYTTSKHVYDNLPQSGPPLEDKSLAYEKKTDTITLKEDSYANKSDSTGL